jgi:DNA-binding NtrC family response regulator
MTTKVQSRRVLVVEDDPKWARDMFQWLLEDQCACQVEVASDYKTALGKLHAKPPFDLLVVDVSLSETDPDNIDGLRLLEQANREDLHIPAIIVSGRGAWKISEPELKKLGVQRYMRKEKFETNEFSTAVCAVLGSPPAEIQPIPRGPTLSGAPDRDALAKAKITGSVLIVDDEDGWREEILAFCLREDGYDVQTAKTYDEAIRRIDAYKFDVAIVDLNLSESEPVARGWILLRKIREQGADTQVIVISGQPVTGDDLERALRYHVFDFIKKGKGFDFDVLLSKVQRAIRSRAAGDQAQHVGSIKTVWKRPCKSYAITILTRMCYCRS